MPIAALALFVVAPPAVASAKPASKIVVTPKAGQKVESSPVRVSIRAPWKVEELRAWLNGRSISRELAQAKIGSRNQRKVRVSASHGLRYGTNVLLVSRKRYGKKPRRQRVRFRLTRDRPLVGAGRDRRVEVGRSIQLNGRASRARNARRSGESPQSGTPGTPAGLEMRWRLVRKPPGSKAHHEGPGSIVQPTDEALATQPKPDAQPARPRLRRLDRPGRYVSELVVVDRGVESVADRVVTEVVFNNPLVPIDTGAAVGPQDRGIAIGDYSDEGAGAPGQNAAIFPLGSGDALQLVVLDRRTLETVESWSGPPTSASIATLTAKLKAYDDSRLAIVTAWSDRDDWSWSGAAGGHPTQQLASVSGQGVNLIGAPRLSALQIDSNGLEQGGQLSWIGVPGFHAGQGWYSGGRGMESLQGFLSKDNNDNYAYLATDPTTYDLGPDGQSVSMTIGDTAISGSLPAGQGGFLVAYLSATGLGPPNADGNVPDGQATYATRNANGSPNFGEMARMSRDLKAASTQGVSLVVAIRSIGTAPLARMPQTPFYDWSSNQQYAGALTELADWITTVGGTRQLIWGMATAPTGRDSYSLLGFNDLSITGLPAETAGADLGSQLKPRGQRRLSGILSRDKQSHYVPKMAANQAFGAELYALSLADSTEWPHSSTPGEQAALRCIGQARGLGPDPRVPYWNGTYSDVQWAQKQGDIKEMQPSDCPDVDATDLTNVRDELVTEIGWLLNVKGYIDALTNPFTADGLSAYADLQSITQEVVAAVSPPATKQTGIDGLAIFADVLDIAADFEVPATGAIAGILFLADDLSSTSDDGPTTNWGQRVEAGSANVGRELAQQLALIAGGNERLAGIIAADYAKLKTVGERGQCTPGETGCTPQWQFTEDQQNAASRMYEITAKRQIWGGVLPAGYPFVLYLASNEEDPGDISSCKVNGPRPFPGIEEPAFLRYGIYEPPPAEWRDAVYPMLVFAKANSKYPPEGSGTFPPPGLVKPLFAPRDPGGDPDRGGLGLDQYSFMNENWQWPVVAQGGPTRVSWVGC